MSAKELASAKQAALAELKRIGIEDRFVAKLKTTTDPGWVAQYRSRSQFTGAGRGPIFWVSPASDAALAEAFAETGEGSPSRADVLRMLTDSLLHEYGHVIAEWAWARSEPMRELIRKGWPGEHKELGRNWDEERFAEDFAQWLRGGFVYGDEALLKEVADLYRAEAFA